MQYKSLILALGLLSSLGATAPLSTDTTATAKFTRDVSSAALTHDIAKREITSSLSPRQIELGGLTGLLSSLTTIVVETLVNGVTTTIGQVGGVGQNSAATAAALVTTLAPVASNTVVILTNGAITVVGTAGALTEALDHIPT